MHPRVSRLYLEFMLLAPSFTSGRGGPAPAVRLPGAAGSTGSYRAMIQKRFMAEPRVTPGTDEFKRRMAHGRWSLRQLQDIIDLKRYRAMHKRYGWSSMKSEGELAELHGEDLARVMMMGLGNKDVYGYDNIEKEEEEEEDENDCKCSDKKK